MNSTFKTFLRSVADTAGAPVAILGARESCMGATGAGHWGCAARVVKWAEEDTSALDKLEKSRARCNIDTRTHERKL
jgi:hypothetical protein